MEEKNRIRYQYLNSRTNQEMPISIKFYNDFIENESKLSIKTALLNYSGKFLACFGSFDQVVPNQYALDMTKWATNSSILKLELTILLALNTHGLKQIFQIL